MIAKKGEKNPVRLPPGEARVQFIAHLDEIQQLVRDGYSIRHIYLKLFEEGKITMAQRTFSAIARPRQNKKNNEKRIWN